MYFKSLDIVGFKSFMNKTKLKFEPGVTTIVGPNGCGKSNVVDAIKWVLGEQSPKSMRSSNMQDVIFSGTEKNDPLNMAEVSLTFSNEDRALSVDYDEVTISRRLFRSGESFYFLNKTPVRLTDIKNILMGTGIGTSAYSIVEQGRLDLILNAKPEDRRHVFEEASGITKFRARKREALLKLEHTRNNLTRITDIIHEVERQIKAIERQARKAEKYKQFYDRLKELDVKLSYKNFRELKTDDSSLNGKNTEMRELSEKLKKQLEEATAALARQRGEYNSIMRDLQESQGEVMRLSSEIDKNDHTRIINGERIQELGRYTEQLSSEIEKISVRKEALYSRLDGLRVKCTDISGRREIKERELSAAEESVRKIQETVENHREELKNNREKTVDIISEETQIKNKLIRINADIHNMMAREKRLRIEKSDVEAEKGEVCEELGRAEEKAEFVKRALEEKRRESCDFNSLYSSKQQELFLLNEGKREKENRLHEIRPRREFLEKLISEREGIGESVKAIMKRVETGDSRFEGVRGILSEIVSVNEEYEETLEFLLGDISQALVVENRTAADNVVKFLEENSMGSVSFLILEEVDRIGVDEVAQLLTGQEEYSMAVSNILRDVSVSRTPDSLIGNIGEFTGRIIGRKGEIRQKGMYRSRNHSQKEVISLFGRKEKVEQLRAEEDDIKRSLADIVEKAGRLEEWLKEAGVTKERLDTELRERQMEFADAQSKREAIKEKADSLAEEILLLDTELQEELAAIREHRGEGERLDQRLNEIGAENAKLQELIEESQKIIQEGTRERENALYVISDMKAELSALRKEEENLTDNLSREEENYGRIDSEVQERQERVADNSRRIVVLEEEIKTLEARNLEYNATVEIKTKENEEKNAQKDSLEKEIARAEAQSREAEEELEKVRNQVRDLDILKKEIEYKRSGLVEKIRDTYKVDLSGLSMELDGPINWEEVVAEIDDLRSRLDKMGEVSHGAVEEHNELKRRYEFLVKQKDDLVKGVDSLMQAITRINRTTRKMFVETFDAVRSEFQDYFRMLFNGGKADLILTDETNILESGVDIIAKPPGKKLQNISLLSGGEKALTAIALVFALFKVNPSPFCILDEIDAPLDESNVVRFSRVLQEFLKTSQFIIVTHNRTTIRLADILYGVTMEEKGVSKIVSVKFADEEEVFANEGTAVSA